MPRLTPSWKYTVPTVLVFCWTIGSQTLRARASETVGVTVPKEAVLDTPTWDSWEDHPYTEEEVKDPHQLVDSPETRPSSRNGGVSSPNFVNYQTPDSLSVANLSEVDSPKTSGLSLYTDVAAEENHDETVRVEEQPNTDPSTEKSGFASLADCFANYDWKDDDYYDSAPNDLDVEIIMEEPGSSAQPIVLDIPSSEMTDASPNSGSSNPVIEGGDFTQGTLKTAADEKVYNRQWYEVGREKPTSYSAAVMAGLPKKTTPEKVEPNPAPSIKAPSSTDSNTHTNTKPKVNTPTEAKQTTRLDIPPTHYEEPHWFEQDQRGHVPVRLPKLKDRSPPGVKSNKPNGAARLNRPVAATTTTAPTSARGSADRKNYQGPILSSEHYPRSNRKGALYRTFPVEYYATEPSDGQKKRAISRHQAAGLSNPAEGGRRPVVTKEDRFLRAHLGELMQWDEVPVREAQITKELNNYFHQNVMAINNLHGGSLDPDQRMTGLQELLGGFLANLKQLYAQAGDSSVQEIEWYNQGGVDVITPIRELLAPTLYNRDLGQSVKFQHSILELMNVEFIARHSRHEGKLIDAHLDRYRLALFNRYLLALMMPFYEDLKMVFDRISWGQRSIYLGNYFTGFATQHRQLVNLIRLADGQFAINSRLTDLTRGLYNHHRFETHIEYVATTRQRKLTPDQSPDY
ncbi:hypothetical protein BJ085DRAFT_37478 [Dimargaris cristalligena]|uniref:Uncharacterized protein n=1 Tax=Dimargaris cristalligena TaxID=215637 RepID=A0A4Q0A2W3_9FUNG|nr:hypothetical protein BJ085DRAFT_37478 [Dimargaris cristalligena]|eukprot:RKP40434.1 hypothetical protein BJ085DRAFT_37478 [Dimargaris cristalligena]